MIVWQQSYDFAKGVYALTRSLPAEERFGLASQLSRAAMSLPARIAEGQRRRGREFSKLLHFAQGDAAECETYLLLIQDLFPDKAQTASQLREQNAVIQRMLGALAYSIEHPKTKDAEKLSQDVQAKEPVCVPVNA